MSTLSTAAPAKFDPNVPIHHQMYLQLRSEIEDGLWWDSDDFPGEKALATRFGTSVITSRAALDRLSADGWIKRRRGKRPQVLHHPSASPRADGPVIYPVGPFPDYAYTVLAAGRAVAPAEACAALNRPLGTSLWRCWRSREFDGHPHSVAHNVQLPEIGERHTALDLASRPMVALLSAQNLTVARMRRRMGVASAPTSVSTALGLSVAERVLVCTFTLHDSKNAVLQWVRIYLHPDRDTPDEVLDLTTGTWSASQPL